MTICSIALLLLSFVCLAQTSDEIARKSELLESKVVRVEAQLRKGFLYPYHLYVPPKVAKQKKQNKMQTLLVLPNNTGSPDDSWTFTPTIRKSR